MIERDRDECLVALKSERESRYALQREFDSRLSQHSAFNRFSLMNMSLSLASLSAPSQDPSATASAPAPPTHGISDADSSVSARTRAPAEGFSMRPPLSPGAASEDGTVVDADGARESTPTPPELDEHSPMSNGVRNADTTADSSTLSDAEVSIRSPLVTQPNDDSASLYGAGDAQPYSNSLFAELQLGEMKKLQVCVIRHSYTSN